MTTGSYQSGPNGPYYTNTMKSWNGLDDRLHKKAWNVYVMDAERRLVIPGDAHYSMGIGTGLTRPSWTDDDQLRLLDKLASKMKQHEFNAAVFAGQLGEVKSSVVGTITALIGIKRSLQRGDLGGAMRFLARSIGGADYKAAKKKLSTRDVAGAHLSLVYGWLPLVSDVYAASKALEVLANPPRRQSITVSRSVHYSDEGSQSPSNYQCPLRHVVSQKTKFVMTEELSALRSLGLMDPASVLWELTPYSFVVDWFVPIGTYLSNLAVIPKLRGEFYTTSRATVIGECHTSQPNYVGGHASISAGKLTRHPMYTSVSVPLPRFRGLRQLTDSSSRVNNAIALLRNAWKR